MIILAQQHGTAAASHLLTDICFDAVMRQQKAGLATPARISLLQEHPNG